MEEILFKDWLSALGWTVLGIGFIKVLIYPHKQKFELKKWISENTKDVLSGLLLTLVALKLGLVAIVALAKVFHIDLEGFEEVLNSVNLDSSQFALIVAMVFQYRLYKYNKSSITAFNGGELPEAPPKKP